MHAYHARKTEIDAEAREQAGREPAAPSEPSRWADDPTAKHAELARRLDAFRARAEAGEA